MKAARPTLLLRNRQRDRRLDLRFLRRVLRQVLATECPGGSHELCFHFVSATEMARVNWQFLQHTGSTDVITFDYTNSQSRLHGEAFICVADAVQQAREYAEMLGLKFAYATNGADIIEMWPFTRDGRRGIRPSTKRR